MRRQILFLGQTVWGSQHDDGLFKTEFPPELAWFAKFKIWIDLGYLGFATDYQTLERHIPHKKPRKSQANLRQSSGRSPTPTLSDAQKAANRTVSPTRIVVEHVLASIKHWTILTAKFRHHLEQMEDKVIWAAAGLPNFLLNLAS